MPQTSHEVNRCYQSAAENENTCRIRAGSSLVLATLDMCISLSCFLTLAGVKVILPIHGSYVGGPRSGTVLSFTIKKNFERGCSGAQPCLYRDVGCIV